MSGGRTNITQAKGKPADKPTVLPAATPALPDLRFEQTFRQSLRREALKHNKFSLSAADGSVVDPPITAYVVAKVVLRDIMLNSFLQGVAASLFMILAAPWLKRCRLAGRTVARRILDALFGKQQFETTRRL